MPTDIQAVKNIFGQTELFIKNQFQRVALYDSGSIEAFVLKIGALKDNNDKYLTDFVDKNLAKEYIIQARKEAKKLGLQNSVSVSFATKQYLDDIKNQFLTMNRQYYEGAVKAVRHFGNVFSQLQPTDIIKGGIKEINLIVREAVINEMTGAQLTKQLADYVSQDAAGIFNKVTDQTGITKLQSINSVTGKVINYDPVSLAETWARTAMRDMTERARHDYYLANKLDLVIVSSHGDACPLCVPWEGRILSITGKTEGYYTVDQARAAGLFHPNCEHNTYSYYANEEKAVGAKPEFSNLTEYQEKLVTKAGVTA
ncbi:MAG: phage minor capsid protein [Candidatus Omnitrophota bacterium]|jgi:hypothetical protein